MPKAIKTLPGQRSLPLNSNDDDMLDRLEAIDEDTTGTSLSLYGRPKSGKTRMACTFPKPLLILGSEKGTKSVKGLTGIDFFQLVKCTDLSWWVEYLKKGGPSKWKNGKKSVDNRDRPLPGNDPYDTGVLDNGTGLRDLRIKEILGLEELPVQKGFGFASRDQWMECAQSMKHLLRPLFLLFREGTLKNIVVVAQEQNYGGGENGEAASDLIKPTVSSALGKSLCDWINAECDSIGQTLIRMKTVRTTRSVAGKQVAMVERTGAIEYCLRVQPDEVYYAGIRVQQGREIKQDFIVDPSYEKLLKVIKGEQV